MKIKSKSQQISDYVIAFLCLIIVFVCILPVVNILARSLSAPEALMRSEVLLWPKGLNFDAYKYVLTDQTYTRALVWTALLTAIGVCVSLVMTTLCAYPLTFPKLKGRKFITTMIIFTMFFNAGTIPMYLLLKDIGFLNKPVVLIIPYCLNVFYMIIMRSFLFNIPDSLRESAEIDGAGPTRVLISIYLPLSMPVIATLALFYAVGRWNGFSDALMFMNIREYYPIQLLLYNLINAISSIETATQEGFTTPGLNETVKAATVFFATLPILFVYPFAQRYFIQGVTLGAVKE
jgi:putative aldouronate transport system permease protein